MDIIMLLQKTDWSVNLPGKWIYLWLLIWERSSGKTSEFISPFETGSPTW